MIRLTFDEKTREEYAKWFECHRAELEKTFGEYLNKERVNWIHTDRLAELRSFIARASHWKCAYCERKPNDGGGYLEIEHFLPKARFPELAFQLTNLLPSCKQCNTQKSAQANSQGKEIINPMEDSPRNHLKMDPESLLLRGSSPLGESTILTLNKSLNLNKFPVVETNSDGETVRRDGYGAIINRLEAKEAIKKKLDKVMGRENEPEELVCELLDLLKLADKGKPITATWAGLVADNDAFLGLFGRLKREHPDLAEDLESEIEEKRAFSLMG